MPNIENISMYSFMNGDWKNPPRNTCLIQICGQDDQFPDLHGDFAENYQFKFDDLSYPTDVNICRMITEEDATKLYEIMSSAYNRDMHITVHCVAGLSRSGAVAEFGEMLGFIYTGRVKTPNVYVKNLLVKVSGLGYY